MDIQDGQDKKTQNVNIYPVYPVHPCEFHISRYGRLFYVSCLIDQPSRN
jgi:hypothetical protein